MVNTSAVLATAAPSTCFGHTSNDPEQTKTHEHYQMLWHLDKSAGRDVHARCMRTHQMDKWVGTGHGGMLKAVKGNALGLQISAH